MFMKVVVPLLLCCHATFRVTGGTLLEEGNGVHEGPPTLDDLWDGHAYFKPHVSIPINSNGFQHIDAGTRIVVINSTWYLFGRWDTGPTVKCPGGEISINVRASMDQGITWSSEHVVVKPDEVTTCIFADGSAFYDTESSTWHYLVQELDVGGKGGWQLSHFMLQGASPFGDWKANPHNPVVHGGDLFGRICSGVGKHCAVGMVDEGTPEIVEKVGGDFYVTFHGYDYKKKAAARGVARTADFVTWEVSGGSNPLPADVIFSDLDCSDWNVSWANDKCIGSGEASILRVAASGYIYEVIEAADVALTCDTQLGAQWWPLGLVRSKQWAPSPRWEQMGTTPFVGGPAGLQPHVGCSIQYNSFHVDNHSGITFFAFWDVSFHPVNVSAPAQTWHVYALDWARGAFPPSLPMRWPGPAQLPPPPPPPQPNCTTSASCKATCAGYVACPSDDVYYCCRDTLCTGTHTCTGNAGLEYCACN
eukprot:m.1375956 g.1375956  ORF g.1375956 m.1375956 type:complete len:476 (+) comp24962_c1_seq7:121-1548(+)